MNCPRCGFANLNNDAICKNCGNELTVNKVSEIFGDDILKPVEIQNTVEENQVDSTSNVDPVIQELDQIEDTNINQNEEVDEVSISEEKEEPEDIYIEEPSNKEIKEPFDLKKTLVIVGGIVLASLIILLAVLVLTKSMNNKYQGNNPSTTSTDYKIIFKGYEIKLPEILSYSINGENLIVKDKNSDWMTIIKVNSFNYSNLMVNKDNIKASLEKTGITLTDMTQNTYHDVSFLTSEIKKGNTSMLLGITKASTTESFVIISMNSKEQLSYDGIEQIALILKSASYVGDLEIDDTNLNNIDFSLIKG